MNSGTILMSIPKNIYKVTATKVTVIGTEIGFIIISVVFLVMYILESVISGSYYQVRLGLSWTCVGVNLAIILFQIIVGIVEFFRKRKEERRKAQERKQASHRVIDENSNIRLQNSHDFGASNDLMSPVDENRSLTFRISATRVN